MKWINISEPPKYFYLLSVFACKNDWSLSKGAEELCYFSLLGEGMNLQGVQQELAPTFATLWFILFLGFIVNCCMGLEGCLISHRRVTLKQGFSPRSLMPWQWSPLHSPDLHRRNVTPLPRALCRVHSCHRRRAVAVAMQRHPTCWTRDQQAPAPERCWLPLKAESWFT